MVKRLMVVLILLAFVCVPAFAGLNENNQGQQQGQIAAQGNDQSTHVDAGDDVETYVFRWP